jgi:hypothetical protein
MTIGGAKFEPYKLKGDRYSGTHIGYHNLNEEKVGT